EARRRGLHGKERRNPVSLLELRQVPVIEDGEQAGTSFAVPSEGEDNLAGESFPGVSQQAKLGEELGVLFQALQGKVGSAALLWVQEDFEKLSQSPMPRNNTVS
ncbi:Hypothetical predicted protein, partial [Pelobates cultripes]